jgi:hypothetical protein
VNIVKPCTTCLTHLPSPLSDLRGETSLDGLDGTSRSAAVARDEVEAVLTLGQTALYQLRTASENSRNLLCVWRTARLARDVFDNVPPEHVLNLLLLEATLDDQPAVASDGTAGTQLGEQELCNMLLGTLHALANLGDVGEDGLLVAFAKTLRWGDLVATRACAGKVRML